MSGDGQTRRTADTKARVLSAALKLFNDEGTAAVSTNHVAAAAGISPGNLYYHYANKEEIVGALFDRMNAEADAVWGSGDLRAIVLGNVRLFREYAFFARELPALLHADAKLRRRFRRVQGERLAQLEAIFRGLVAAGVVRDPGGDAAIAALVERCFVVSFFWGPYSEIAGMRMDASRARRGAEHVLEILRPWLADGMLEMLRGALATSD